MLKGRENNITRPMEPYEDRDTQRVNNPPVGFAMPETDPDARAEKKVCADDAHPDPPLVWAGKAEHTSVELLTVSLHVHERTDPETSIAAGETVNRGQRIVSERADTVAPVREGTRRTPARGGEILSAPARVVEPAPFRRFAPGDEFALGKKHDR